MIRYAPLDIAGCCKALLHFNGALCPALLGLGPFGSFRANTAAVRLGGREASARGASARKPSDWGNVQSPVAVSTRRGSHFSQSNTRLGSFVYRLGLHDFTLVIKPLQLSGGALLFQCDLIS